jgi:hypothetical protein
MALRAPRTPTDRLDEAIGFIGFFAVMMLGVTILCEVTGRPALGWALFLLALVVAEALLWRRRTVIRWRAAQAAVPAAPARSTADRAGAPGR